MVKTLSVSSQQNFLGKLSLTWCSDKKQRTKVLRIMGPPKPDSKKRKQLTKEEAEYEKLQHTMQNADYFMNREQSDKEAKKLLLEYGQNEKVSNVKDVHQTIFQTDIDRLSTDDTLQDHEKYLNSTVLAFSLAEATRNLDLWDFLGIVVFSVHFFTCITAPHLLRKHEKSYEQVRNLHLLLDLFARKIVVVPIHSFSHWSLAVVVRPDSLLSGGSENVCKIYHLDSLKRFPLHDTRDIGFRLKQYMLSVWLDDRDNPRKDSISETQMRVAMEKIPVHAVSDNAQQENDFDCGTYMSLYFKKIVALYSVQR